MEGPPHVTPPFLSVVVPAYNQAGSIGENVVIIQERVREALGRPFETIVVSDGSVDSTQDRVPVDGLPGVRVFHYDRNLGKGYAIKLGALEARGRWVGYVDADLDLDPADLARFVEVAEREGLDFAIGSKRHPESQVQYPRSRRVASWLFQQFVRVLFRLDVRDTQVGLKVFRRDVVEQVMPFLLVKRFAFDLELLAVGRAFGFHRIRELPIHLDYRFTGSGVRSSAVFRALIDTAAIWYRLRVLRYYQRRRAIVGRYGWTRPGRPDAAVTVVAEHGAGRRAAVERAPTELVAFVARGARPAANWLDATVPFLARGEIAAVVTPNVAPLTGDPRERAAAAASESRLGGGSLYFRFTPGNIRLVDDFPTASLVVRRTAFLGLPPGTPVESVVRELADRGHLTLYTPETVVVSPPPPLFRPYLRRTLLHARDRGRRVRRRGFRALRLGTVLAVALALLACASVPAALVGGPVWTAWLLAAAGYAVSVLAAALAGGIRHGSAAVGVLTAAAFVLTHATYVVGFVSGLARREPRPRAVRVSATADRP